MHTFKRALLAAAILICNSGIAMAAPVVSGGPSLDQRINEMIGPFADTFANIIFAAVPVNGIDFPVIVLWLITAGVLLTIYTRFTNIRRFGLALRIVRGDYDDPEDRGEVTHFQALSAALSGTVGLGNIAGVAVAIGLGGPGATLWMIIAGFFGMTSKFMECTLATKYRKIREDGVVSGGPMYYLKQGLAEKGMPRFGAVLAVIFSVFCVCGSFGGGNMFQVNQALQQVEGITGGTNSFFHGQGWIFGLIMAGFVALVIIGGIRSIARVTAKLVPIMCFIYVGAAIVILFEHASHIPAAFHAIISGAFSPESIGGGIVGVIIQGFRRATFSNEAGVGSAPIAHAAVKTNEPVTEGLVALLEPFIDTVVICTMTALVIVITNTYQQTDLDGVSMTSAAFGDVITWFPLVLSLAVVLFAFSTQITWSYYGLKAWTYLIGDTKTAELSYKLLFCAFTVIGASLKLDKVVDFSDAAVFAMSLPNLIGVYILAPVARKELNSFLARIRVGDVAIKAKA